MSKVVDFNKPLLYVVDGVHRFANYIGQELYPSDFSYMVEVTYGLSTQTIFVNIFGKLRDNVGHVVNVIEKPAMPKPSTMDDLIAKVGKLFPKLRLYDSDVNLGIVSFGGPPYIMDNLDIVIQRVKSPIIGAYRTAFDNNGHDVTIYKIAYQNQFELEEIMQVLGE